MLKDLERTSGEARLPHTPPDTDLYIAAISISELRMGALRAVTSAQRSTREEFLRNVLDAFTWVPFGLDEAVVHADIHAALRDSGQLIGERDLQIAATALAHDHDVLTYNVGEFARVPGLRVLTVDAEDRVVEA